MVSTPTWPGVRSDVTSRSSTHQEVMAPADPPDAYTLCDRCHSPLGSTIYALAHHQLGGSPATWFVCLDCHAQFLLWMAREPRLAQLGGT